jgi:hypothetical protein
MSSKGSANGAASSGSSSSQSGSALDALTKGLLKRLGNSHDGHDRAKAVRAVGHWMRNRKNINLEDLLKIWSVRPAAVGAALVQSQLRGMPPNCARIVMRALTLLASCVV